MKILGTYPLGVEKYFQGKFPNELNEILGAITSVNADDCKTKKSKEKTKEGKELYSPGAFNMAFKNYLLPLDWEKNLKVE